MKFPSPPGPSLPSVRRAMVWLLPAFLGLLSLMAQGAPQGSVALQTNTSPATVSTNAAPAGGKSFHWFLSWEGWNGLQAELSQQTPLGDAMVGLRQNTWLTNAPRLVHLEELTMTAKLGIKMSADAAGYVTSPDFQGFDPGVELRRFCVYAKGDCLLLMPVSYQIELGYNPNQFSLQDSYVTFTNVGFLGAMQAGQFKAPMSLEVLTSSRDSTFMEPAAPVQALAPGQNAGVQFSRALFHERATWAFGFFTESVGQDYGDSSQNFGRAITRVTCLPIYEVDPGQPSSARLLHLGLSANVLYSGNSTVEYRSRPESHLAPYVVDTGDVAADGALVAGAEAAWVQGPLSLQAEYLRSFVRETAGETVNFGGFYASACYFLTGETRPYDRRTGAWGRVIPKHNFAWGRGGWGAWEVAARLSHVDLGDGNIQGGRLTEIMCGLNWYLHPHIKWRFNYGFGHVSDYYPAGNINIFQTRVDLDF